MNQIADNILKIKSKLGAKAQLIVVSKYRSTDEIMAAYNSGQRMFAENRVQALLERRDALPKDIIWHLIGHLQTNKVKFIAPFIDMIQAVDSFKLLKEINKEGAKCHRVIPCLLQIYIATEETKFGLEEKELEQLLASEPWRELANIRICGLMAMASLTEDTNQISEEFNQAKVLFEKIKQRYFHNDTAFQELSIGMSSDYPIALEYGSTMVRIGSAVFEG